MRADSFAIESRSSRCNEDFCQCVSVRGTGWARMGVCAGAGEREAVARCRVTASAGAQEVWTSVQDGILDCGPALQCGSRDYWIDGSCAWAVCAPGVVVEIAGEYPGEDEEV